MVIAFVALFGLIIGSFDNALVWRLHEQDELATAPARTARRRQKAYEVEDLSIIKGRSMCPNCRHVLVAKDLVPLLSWIWLRGKCRYCSSPISVQYPLVELLTAGLFVVSYLSWPGAFHGVGLFDFCLWLVFVAAFVALSVYDMHWYLLPDRIVFPIIGLAIIKVLTDETVSGGGLHGFIMVALSITSTAGLFYVLHLVSKGRWIGFGDVKLAIVLGAIAARPAAGLLIIFMSSLLGTVATIPLIVRRRVRATTQIPFGPFLMAATYLTVLYGDKVIAWYGRLLTIR